MPSSREYRDYAAICRSMAETHPEERERWLNLAAIWADRADKAAKEEPPESD